MPAAASASALALSQRRRGEADTVVVSQVPAALERTDADMSNLREETSEAIRERTEHSPVTGHCPGMFTPYARGVPRRRHFAVMAQHDTYRNVLTIWH